MAVVKPLLQRPDELIGQLDLPPSLLPIARQADQLFKTRVSQAFLKNIEPGNLDDPLLKQVLPGAEELGSHQYFVSDPLQEADKNPVPGLLHKYHGRVLLIVTGSCAIHCRYCFRRHFPYQHNNPGKAGWQKALAYIAEDASIEEVILSGGDPLMATDRHLQFLINAIADIPHVKTLRIHTRMPVVTPERITDGLIRLLTTSRLQPVVVIHCNHANELGEQAKEALQKLHHAGVMLLNQSVLLKGVNDDADTLVALSRTLFRSHVLPYYLHMPDKVAGTAHFDVSDTQALALMQALRAKLPGYLVPELVREVPTEKSKIPLAGFMSKQAIA